MIASVVVEANINPDQSDWINAQYEPMNFTCLAFYSYLNLRAIQRRKNTSRLQNTDIKIKNQTLI